VSAPAVLRGVSVFYGEVVGLSAVSIELEPGITGLVGPNGSGKTTLMKVLTGLMRPQEGEVRVAGLDPFTEAEARTGIAFVPAASAFFDGLSAMRNLEVAFLAKGIARAEARHRAGEALKMVRLEGEGKRSYGTLSRGTRQRVKLGLALALEAPLVLLDEPFLGVDPPNRLALRETILRLGSEGRTVVVSSHVLHEVEALTRKVGILAHGRLLGYGRIETLLHDLRDRHPHRIRLHGEEVRVLAAAVVGLEHVREVQVPEPGILEFVTERPDTLYRELPALVASCGAPVRHLEAIDVGLEAVFRHVTEGGTRRL
jgi:ABC-2 type transport system ATP-binding protein